MKIHDVSDTQRQLVLESGDSFRHEIGATGWRGRVMLARHFLRVAWIILRRGRVVHSIHGGEGGDVLPDILDAEYIEDD